MMISLRSSRCFAVDGAAVGGDWNNPDPRPPDTPSPAWRHCGDTALIPVRYLFRAE